MRIKILLITFMLLISALPLPVLALGATFEVVDGTVISAKDCTRGYDTANNKDTPRIEGVNVSFGSGDWCEFDINVAESGVYLLDLIAMGENGGANPSNLVSIFADEQLIGTKRIFATGGWSISTALSTPVATFFLSEGEHTIKVRHDGVNRFYFNSIAFRSFKYDERTFTSIAAETFLDNGNASVIQDSLKIEPDGFGRYTINTIEAARYKVSVIYSASEATEIAVRTNNNESVTMQLSATASEKAYKLADVGEIDVRLGRSTLRVDVSGGALCLGTILLEKIGEYTGTEEPNIVVEPIRIDAPNYKESFDASTGSSSIAVENGKISFATNDWVSYDVEIVQSGLYSLTVEFAGPNQGGYTVDTYLDGKETPESTTLVPETGSYSDFIMYPIALLQLEEGIHTIKIFHKASSGGVYFRSLALEYASGSLQVDEIQAGKTVVTDQDSISPGTDSFLIRFTKQIETEKIPEDAVQLSDGSHNLSCSVQANEREIKVVLLESLIEGGEYTLCLQGIEDIFGLSTLENTTCTFFADGTNAGKAAVEITEAHNEYNSFFVGGVMYSSEGVGIAGRNVKVFLKYPDGRLSDEPLTQVLSGENGVYAAELTIPEGSQEGYYEMVVYGDYVTIDSAETAGVYYISRGREASILQQISETNDPEKVYILLKEIGIYLGLDIDQDIKELQSPLLVFAHIAGRKIENAEELKTLYQIYLAMEKVNQAQTVQAVEDVLYDEEICRILEIEFGKLALLVQQKESFINAVIATESSGTLEEFQEKIHALADKYLALEYGKEAVECQADSMTVYISQGVELPLTFVTKEKDIKEVCYTLTAKPASILDNLRCNIDKDITSDIFVENETVKIRLFSSKGTISSEQLGKVILTAPGSTGKYIVTTGGIVKYDLGLAYDVVVPISEKQITITAVKNNAGNNGGGSKQSSTGITSAGGMIAEPPKNEDATFAFQDMDTAKWAEEAVQSLLNRGIISESEDFRYYPQRNVTRAEFIKMLVEGLGINEINQLPLPPDVTEKDWYYPYIMKAIGVGLVFGNEDGFIRPNDTITREELAAITQRALILIGYSSKSDKTALFSDHHEIAAYAVDGVYTLRAMGIINGMDEQHYAPKSNTTRAMAAKVIYEFLKAVSY